MNRYVPPQFPTSGSSAQYRQAFAKQASDPTSPDANLGLAKLPSQIMANRGPAELERSDAAPSLETIKE